jgi:hypothetical protein
LPLFLVPFAGNNLVTVSQINIGVAVPANIRKSFLIEDSQLGELPFIITGITEKYPVITNSWNNLEGMIGIYVNFFDKSIQKFFVANRVNDLKQTINTLAEYLSESDISLFSVSI